MKRKAGKDKKKQKKKKKTIKRKKKQEKIEKWEKTKKKQEPKKKERKRTIFVALSFFFKIVFDKKTLFVLNQMEGTVKDLVGVFKPATALRYYNQNWVAFLPRFFSDHKSICFLQEKETRKM